MNPISEELLTLAQVIAESQPLRAWFVNLAAQPPSTRSRACKEMALSMKANGETPALIEAVGSLARPDLFNALLQTLPK
jgi:hypothetical protein